MGLYILKFSYRKVLLPLAKKLCFVDPDLLSYAAVLVTIGTGFCYYFAFQYPFLLLLAIFLIFMRMTVNTIDGVIALEQKKDTLKGEIVNALPDRYSDIFHLMGIVLSPLCGKSIGFLGLASVFLVSYTGMLGKALGVEWQHHGPLGKVERLILLMFFSLIQFISITKGHAEIAILGFSFSPLEWCMMIFVVLGQITVLNRLRGMLGQINKVEWNKKEKYKLLQKKVLVVYDSVTGNTEKVANEIGRCLHAEVKSVKDVQNVEKYDVVIIGTPNIRKYPTERIVKFIERFGTQLNQYALFVTWGMPIWGLISTRDCFRYMIKAIKKKPLGVLASKGYHVKYKTNKGHPNDQDLLAAYYFGIKIAKKLGVN